MVVVISLNADELLSYKYSYTKKKHEISGILKLTQTSDNLDNFDSFNQTHFSVSEYRDASFYLLYLVTSNLLVCIHRVSSVLLTWALYSQYLH